VTEFRQRLPTQAAPILLEVEYLSEIEIKERLKELLWSFVKAFLPGNDDPAISASQFKQIDEESTTAWALLQAAFSHQADFSRNSLQDQTEGAFKKNLEQLVGWTRDLQWPEGEVDGKWSYHTSEAEDCLEKMDIFFTDRFWPFTKIIR
jgi:hypothetical protein